MTISTYQMPYKASLVASLMLVLAVLQGTSFTLTMAMRSPIASNAASALVTVTWLLMYLVSFVGLISSSGLNWATWIVRYRLLLTLLVSGAAFSAIWSMDSVLTTERSVHLIGSTLVAFYLGFSLPLARILKVSALVLGLLMLASMVTALWLPSLGLENYEGQLVWAGVMTSKNTLGFWAAVSVLLLVSLSFWSITPIQRLIYLALSLAAVTCLYFSESATSVLALITASLIMLYLYTAFNLRLGLISMIVLGLLAASLAIVAFRYIDTAELIGRSGDLTGRGEVWEQTWKLILQRPLTGFGYGALWYPTSDSAWIQQTLTDFSWTVFHAHNGLLQIASEIGLPLTVLTLFMIVQQLVEIVYCQYQRQQPGVLFVLGFTIALLISNYSEARLLVNRELYWILFIALPISMLQQVTLSSSRIGLFGTPTALSVYNSERIKLAREQLSKRRVLKKRLRKRRRITVINATQGTQSSAHALPEQDSANEHGTAMANKIESSRNTALLSNDGREALKRKMARRERKAG